MVRFGEVVGGGHVQEEGEMSSCGEEVEERVDDEERRGEEEELRGERVVESEEVRGRGQDSS